MQDMHGGTSALVAMSGGVDSAVAAWLLQEKGVRVEALFLRLVKDEYSARAEESARELCTLLGIKFHKVDYSGIFRERIIKYFLNSYRQGLTPNPCVRCNPDIKVNAGLEKMKSLGLSFLATGHYARILHGDKAGMLRLFAGADSDKDQSYFLHGLTSETLEHLFFPLGSMHKKDVRQIARRAGLASTIQAESQDVCFLRGDYRQFLNHHGVQDKGPGQMITQHGDVVGMHSGLQNYTVGQRKGLGLPGPAPSYVIRMETDTNRLVVGPREELFSPVAWVRNVNWLVPDAASDGTLNCAVRIRYRHTPAPAVVSMRGNRVHVEFKEPQRAITPGQYAVFYQGDMVLGGGEICA